MHAVVDLYRFRCAVAALVVARHHIHMLNSGDIARADVAIGHLTGIAGHLTGEPAAATSALLCPEPDPGGRRTVRAIDRLADIAHVDHDAAAALAASLQPAPVQGTLFDDTDSTP